METLCKIRDVYRAIAEFEVQFVQKYDLSLNEGMLLCTLLEAPKLTSGEMANVGFVGFQYFQGDLLRREEETDSPSRWQGR